jgi:predicted NUDIX family NTP pyrophosphohydrolase
MRLSSGTLLYRAGTEGLEVLLVHPSGNYNRKAPWSIPKGEPDLEEKDDMEKTARRETWEETGVQAGELFSLGHVDYSKRAKRIFCFAGPAPVEAAPRCASWEVDQAAFVGLPRARQIIHRDQCAFLDRLEERLRDEK